MFVHALIKFALARHPRSEDSLDCWRTSSAGILKIFDLLVVLFFGLHFPAQAAAHLQNLSLHRDPIRPLKILQAAGFQLRDQDRKLSGPGVTLVSLLTSYRIDWPIDRLFIDRTHFAGRSHSVSLLFRKWCFCTDD
jgi:hypothetical protein